MSQHVGPATAVPLPPQPGVSKFGPVRGLCSNRWLRLGAATALVLLAVLPVAVPWIDDRLTHSITADAFVQTHLVNAAHQEVSGQPGAAGHRRLRRAVPWQGRLGQAPGRPGGICPRPGARRELYASPDAWVRKAILNVAHSYRFSSDRTIRECAAEIWNAKPCPVD